MGNPINIWQRQDPNADVPEKCPFVAQVDWDVHQFTKDGVLQSQPIIVGIDDIQPVNVPPPLLTNSKY